MGGKKERDGESRIFLTNLKRYFSAPLPERECVWGTAGLVFAHRGQEIALCVSQYCRREESADGGARSAWLGSPVGEEGSDQLSLHREMLQGTIGNICKDIMGHERFKAGKHRVCYRLVIYPGGRQVLYSL